MLRNFETETRDIIIANVKEQAVKRQLQLPDMAFMRILYMLEGLFPCALNWKMNSCGSFIIWNLKSCL